MLNDLSPILVTGGAGFIGSNFVLDWLALVGSPLVNLDKLTYAGNLQNLTSIENHPGYHFEQGDICDAPLLDRLLDRYQPRAILHFAAESHVDRSLSGPEAFVRTNVDGTFRLLEAARAYLAKLTPEDRQKFSACLDRRGVRYASPPGSAVRGDHRLRSQQSVCRLQGGFRSSGTRLRS
jgi:dTDP-glucose 4,6-dehydratase